MSKSTRTLTICAILIAIGTIMPMLPFKIIIPPASYTLASHVAVFIAMFISPGVAVTVALGTSLGFLLSGMDMVIIARALSHVVFALVGALYLKNHKTTLDSPNKTLIFALIISLIHVICETIVVLPFYTGTDFYAYLQMVFLTVGFGGFIHSMVDFYIAIFVYNVLKRHSLVDY